MSGEKRDIDFYTLYDNEGRAMETFKVEHPTDSELRDNWVIGDGEGRVLGLHQTRIGRVKAGDVLVNRMGLEGACCYQVGLGEYAELLARMQAAAELEEYEPPRDERFAERFVRAEVRGGKVRVRLSEEVWEG